MKCVLSLIAFSLLLSPVLRGYDLRTKALVPVEFKAAPTHQPLTMVKDGKLRFAIVTDTSSERMNPKVSRSIVPAVTILQEAFLKCTGQTPDHLDISETEKLNAYPVLLVVGENALTRKHGLRSADIVSQGFEIKTFDRGIFIVGHDSSLVKGYNSKPLETRGSSTGTKYGAYDFVERFLGVRYYYPGQYGSLYPALRDFTVQPVHYGDHPRFDTREGKYYLSISVGTPAGKKFWEPYLGKLTAEDQRFGDRWRMGFTIPNGGFHCPRPDHMAKAYPKDLKTIFYTSPSGNFYYNKKQHIGNYFDVVNLKFADLLLNSYKKYYDSNGSIDEGGYHFGDGLNLAYASFGCCDTLMPLTDIIDHPTVVANNLISQQDKDTSAMRNVYARFHQYLATRMKTVLPGIKLYLLAYYNAQLAGTDPRWKLPDNVEVTLCLDAILTKGRNPKIARKYQTMAREWYESLGKRPVQRIWLYDVQDQHPFTKAVAGEFVGDVPKILGKYLGRTELIYDHCTGSPGSLWFYYTSAYSVYRLMWNPEWDVEAALDEHWTLMYGKKAGPILKEFHDLVKDSVIKYYVPSDTVSVLYPFKVLNRLEALLQAAKAALPSDSVEMKRFKLIAAPWKKAIESQKRQQTYERPIYAVHRLADTDSVQVDGTADDACWADIAPMPFMDPNGSGQPPKYPITFKLAWNSKGIYGMCATSYPVKADANLDLWYNCGMELLFAPGLKKEVMYQFAFDACNQIFLGMHRLLPIPMPYDSNWKAPGFTLKSTLVDKRWNAEFFIPFAVFDAPVPKPYDCWLFNAVKNKKSTPKEFSGTAMTIGNNHNINMYGIIKFAGFGD